MTKGKLRGSDVEPERGCEHDYVSVKWVRDAGRMIARIKCLECGREGSYAPSAQETSVVRGRVTSALEPRLVLVRSGERVTGKSGERMSLRTAFKCILFFFLIVMVFYLVYYLEEKKHEALPGGSHHATPPSAFAG
jgi:hypothetical protein